LEREVWPACKQLVGPGKEKKGTARIPACSELLAERGGQTPKYSLPRRGKKSALPSKIKKKESLPEGGNIYRGMGPDCFWSFHLGGRSPNKSRRSGGTKKKKGGKKNSGGTSAIRACLGGFRSPQWGAKKKKKRPRWPGSALGGKKKKKGEKRKKSNSSAQMKRGKKKNLMANRPFVLGYETEKGGKKRKIPCRRKKGNLRGVWGGPT